MPRIKATLIDYLVIVADVAAILLAVASVVVAVRDPGRRALHDLIAGTRVIAVS